MPDNNNNDATINSEDQQSEEMLDLDGTGQADPANVGEDATEFNEPDFEEYDRDAALAEEIQMNEMQDAATTSTAIVTTTSEPDRNSVFAKFISIFCCTTIDDILDQQEKEEEKLKIQQEKLKQEQEIEKAPEIVFKSKSRL